MAFKPGAKKEKEKADKEDLKERILLVGKLTAKDAKTRYARLGDGEAIFVLGEKAVAILDREPLDLLDRQLLFLDPPMIKSLHMAKGKEAFTLTRDKDSWRAEGSGMPPFVADSEVVNNALLVWWPLGAKTGGLRRQGGLGQVRPG